MDRISALRNVEDALAEFEAGEVSLEELEREVTTVLRTYATDFESGERTVYRVEGADRTAGVVVVAESPGDARNRAREVADVDPTAVERLSDPGARK